MNNLVSNFLIFTLNVQIIHIILSKPFRIFQLTYRLYYVRIILK